jgi:hypothetical protein
VKWCDYRRAQTFFKGRAKFWREWGKTYYLLKKHNILLKKTKNILCWPPVALPSGRPLMWYTPSSICCKYLNQSSYIDNLIKVSLGLFWVSIWLSVIAFLLLELFYKNTIKLKIYNCLLHWSSHQVISIGKNAVLKIGKIIIWVENWQDYYLSRKLARLLFE